MVMVFNRGQTTRPHLAACGANAWGRKDWIILVAVRVMHILSFALLFQVEGKTEENETNKRRRKGLFGAFEEVSAEPELCQHITSSLISTSAEEAAEVGGLGLGLLCLVGTKSLSPSNFECTVLCVENKLNLLKSFCRDKSIMSVTPVFFLTQECLRYRCVCFIPPNSIIWTISV